MRGLLVMFLLLPSLSMAQDTGIFDGNGGFVPNLDTSDEGGMIEAPEGSASARDAVEVDRGTGAVLRSLDKMSGSVRDIELRSGQSERVGRIEVRLDECRYPAENPSGNAYAFLEIRDVATSDLTFQGWMIASSPALNALEHPRYDVWVMRCTRS